MVRSSISDGSMYAYGLYSLCFFREERKKSMEECIWCSCSWLLHSFSFFSLKKIFIYLFIKKQSTRLVILGGCACACACDDCCVRCGVDVHVHRTCMVRSSMTDGSMYMSMVCTLFFRDEKEIHGRVKSAHGHGVRVLGSRVISIFFLKMTFHSSFLRSKILALVHARSVFFP